MSMTFGDKLKMIRTEKGMSQDELASLLGTSKQVISRYETNQRTPKITVVSEYATVLSVPLNYLLDNDMNDIEKSRRQYPSNLIPISSDDFVNIPVLGSVAAGSGCLADNEIVRHEPWFSTSIKQGHEYFCLDVQGDSMYPKLEDGDLILVQSQNTVDSGRIAVLTINGDEGVVKKVTYGGDWIELHSINPMYKTRRFEGEDVLEINIIGLVVEVKRKI